MIRKQTQWKIIIWTIAITTLILLAATTVIFQHNVKAIDQQLDNIRTNEIK